MPIRIVNPPDPLSAASIGAEPVVIRSEAASLLAAEMRQYCQGRVTGRTFLISGHRGAGKTTLVKNAFQEVLEEAVLMGRPVRPLAVWVNGPDLFPEAVAEKPEPKAAPRPARRPPGAPGAVTVNVGTAREEEADGKDAAPRGATERQLALRQIVLALHRAVAEEMARAHRERVEAAWKGHPRLPDLLELSAQLEMELFECPHPARLRELWRQGSFLHSGVLFRGVTEERPVAVPPDQGMREVLALAGVCEAYCRVSGTWTEQQRRSESAEARTEASAGADLTVRDVFGVLASLLAGGLVGTGVYAAGPGQGVAATIAGILAALGATAVLKYSSSRSSARSITREASYLRDLSVETLDRFIPILVRRMLQAGIAPVFIVDELDKVPDLKKHMIPLLRQLKKFFAETSFFCFITDRSYLEGLRQSLAARTYPQESTYFTHLLFVVFRHGDLHRYLRRLLIVDNAPPQPLPPPRAARPTPGAGGRA